MIFKGLVPILLSSALVVVTPASPAEEIQLPEMGDSSASVLSLHKEMELGAAFMRHIRQQPGFIEDAELTDYLTDLGNRLASHTDRQPFPFTFFIMRDKSINAFAAPGGYIGMHSGLILAAKSEAEIAGVLAHEIAHVTQHHMARAYEAAGKLTLPTAAAMLAAVLVGTQNAQAGQAAMMAIQAGSTQYQINFTRTNEREADRIGIATLAASGYDPHGMATFFDRLGKAYRFTGSRPPEFLLTHPVTTDRIAEAQTRAGQLKWKAHGNDQRFLLAQARLAVLTTDRPAELIRKFQADKKVAENNSMHWLAAEYGLALANQRLAKSSTAEKSLRWLVRQHPLQAEFHTALARLLLEKGDAASARKDLEVALKTSPENRALRLLFARALIDSGNARAALPKLDQLIIDSRRQDARAWHLKAEAAAKSSLPAEKSLAMAEFYYLTGQTRAAVQQLEAGLRTPGLDFIKTSQLESRLKTLKEQLDSEEEEAEEDLLTYLGQHHSVCSAG